MIKILNIIGARPQIIKAAAISRAIQKHFSAKIQEIIVHTGQHYDHNMSGVFFDELNIPKPNINLNVGSASHGKQTAEMILKIENLITEEKPDCIVVYGDTNSTLAASIAASKLHFPLVHIEAGLRSFNKNMPEEINRIMCDHVSTLLFVPTLTGIENLKNEGFNLNSRGPYTFNNPAIYHCGDIMYDNSLYFSSVAEEKCDILARLGLKKDNFILVTIHRDNNTDIPERLNSIFKAINDISQESGLTFVVPLHPRTSKILDKNLDPGLYNSVKRNSLLKLIEPVSFLEIIMLEKYSILVITDSGGVQKESYFFAKPCIILRPETEWKELVDTGAAAIADASYEKIIKSFNSFKKYDSFKFQPIFGDGKAADFICSKMLENFG